MKNGAPEADFTFFGGGGGGDDYEDYWNLSNFVN